jgi:hypothetical protein
VFLHWVFLFARKGAKIRQLRKGHFMYHHTNRLGVRNNRVISLRALRFLALFACKKITKRSEKNFRRWKKRNVFKIMRVLNCHEKKLLRREASAMA